MRQQKMIARVSFALELMRQQKLRHPWVVARVPWDLELMRQRKLRGARGVHIECRKKAS